MSNRIKKDRRLANLNAEAQVPEISFWASFRKSPFPPPDELERYEGLYPGITKLFFDNFANQTNHRMGLEKTVIEGDNKRANTAQHYSFIITLVFLALAGFLFHSNKDGLAIGSAVTSIVPVIISFLNSSNKRKKEKENKRKNMGLN
jgi:uncharacterized membrane protein